MSEKRPKPEKQWVVYEGPAAEIKGLYHADLAAPVSMPRGVPFELPYAAAQQFVAGSLLVEATPEQVEAHLAKVKAKAPTPSPAPKSGGKKKAAEGGGED